MTATMLGDDRVTTCPLYAFKTIPDAMGKLGKLHTLVEKGFLPDRGGYEDQAALTMEALDFFSAGLSKARADMMKKKKPPKPGAR